jgi:hypothetical protein
VITTFRLVHLIEEDAADMASGLLEKIEHDANAAGYLEHVPSAELWKRVHEIYRHLGGWLTERTAGEVARRYREIGARRADQGLPLSQLLYVILATKTYLHEHVQQHHPPVTQPSEVMADLEMETLLEQFYDHAIFFAALGYEERSNAMQRSHNAGAA